MAPVATASTAVKGSAEFLYGFHRCQMRRVQQLEQQRAAGAVVGQGSSVGFGAWVLMLGCIFQVARPFTCLEIHVQESVHDSVFIQYGNRRFKPLGWTVERRWLHHDAWDGPCFYIRP